MVKSLITTLDKWLQFASLGQNMRHCCCARVGYQRENVHISASLTRNAQERANMRADAARAVPIVALACAHKAPIFPSFCSYFFFPLLFVFG